LCLADPRGRNPGRPVPFVDVKQVTVIAVGGALGSLARYAVALAFGSWDAAQLPWATLTVNLVGCLAIGAVAAIALAGHGPWWVRPFIVTGILGGFTTFSALALEAGLLLDAGRTLVAIAYVAATMVFGLLAVRAGTMIVRTAR